MNGLAVSVSYLPDERAMLRGRALMTPEVLL